MILHSARHDVGVVIVLYTTGMYLIGDVIVQEHFNKETAVICACFHFACQPCALTGIEKCYGCKRAGEKQKRGSNIPTYHRKTLQVPSRAQLDQERHSLLEGLEPSSKISAVLTKLRSIAHRKEKAIVFSQWTSALDMLEHFCGREKFLCARVDGSMAADVRDSSLARFKEDAEVSPSCLDFRFRCILTFLSNPVILGKRKKFQV